MGWVSQPWAPGSLWKVMHTCSVDRICCSLLVTEIGLMYRPPGQGRGEP